MRSSIGGLKVTERTALALLLGCFVTLASLYNLALAVLEGPDEMWHFAYVVHLAAGGGLPVRPNTFAEDVIRDLR